jgi:hypothetical protein
VYTDARQVLPIVYSGGLQYSASALNSIGVLLLFSDMHGLEKGYSNQCFSLSSGFCSDNGKEKPGRIGESSCLVGVCWVALICTVRHSGFDLCVSETRLERAEGRWEIMAYY